MRRSERVHFPWRGQFTQTQGSPIYRTSILIFCLLSLILVACASTTNSSDTHHQSVQTNSGTTITYGTDPQDVLIRLFYGGGKVGKLELSPELSIYGDGSFITGPDLNLQKGQFSSDQLQHLLETLTGNDTLLQLHRQIFSDIPDQNATLLQVNLNGKNYQFLYGPFGNLQESSQDMQEYQKLGAAISAIKNAPTGATTTYTSDKTALLVYETFRQDFTEQQNKALPEWPLADIDLANTAIYECGVIPFDLTGPNADNGCLVYSVPLVALELSQTNQQLLANVISNQQGQMFLDEGHYFVAILRPLLPDEIAQSQLAMYGSAQQDYRPVPLKSGPVPVPTITITPQP